MGQLPQSGYLSLGTPYSYFGLGRTNNYVENLFIGSTRHQPLHFINIEGVIPNSQIVIDPYQPSGRTDPGSWSKELYLHPGDWIPWVTVALGAAIAFLGAIVVALHLNEKVSDAVACGWDGGLIDCLFGGHRERMIKKGGQGCCHSIFRHFESERGTFGALLFLCFSMRIF